MTRFLLLLLCCGAFTIAQAQDGCTGDFNGDGAVNSNDLLTFLSVYGTLCF